MGIYFFDLERITSKVPAGTTRQQEQEEGTQARRSIQAGNLERRKWTGGGGGGWGVSESQKPHQ